MAPGAIRRLGPLAAAITALGRRPDGTIRNVDENSPWSVLQPIPQMGPPGTEPRGFIPNPGQNLIYTPRPDEEYSFEDLRVLGGYPLAQICRENTKDVVTSLPRQIRLRKKPGEKNSDVDKRAQGDSMLAAINEFFDSPDGEHDWAAWLRPLLEDLMVIDAPSILVRRDKGGKARELRVIDGATITRYIDEQGYTPLPPSKAYAQRWYGLPYVDLTTDQLIYRPRNIVHRNTVSSHLYGMSQTEQIANELKLGIERMAFRIAYYMDGSIPDMMQVVPPGHAPEQLRVAQDQFNLQTAGNLGRRRQLMIIQGFAQDGKDQFLFPKEKLLTDADDDRHIAVVAFAYGTPKSRLIKQMTRATAQQDQESAEEEGYYPIAQWVKETVDWILWRAFRARQYELTFDTTKELDPLKRSQVDESDTKNGIKTRNECRADRGLDADPAPEANLLCITTATGVVPLNVDQQVERSQKLAEVAPQNENGNGNGKNGDEPPEPEKAVRPRLRLVSRTGKGKSAKIDAGRVTAETAAATGTLAAAIAKVFRRQRDKAADKADRLLKALGPSELGAGGKKLKKETDDEKAKRIADDIYASVEGEFAGLAPEARKALEQAALSGVNDAIVQIEISDADMISAVNEIAADYASKRAAEMIGMKYSATGELVANPNAKYAITDTTRDELRQIIKNAFEKETPYEDVVSQVREAGAFSEGRAHLIADSEARTAQVRGNFETWKKSGLVKKVKWLCAVDPCDICADNDGEVRELGQAFPSGDLMPLAHPRCNCILQAVEISE
jgi:hypothetical protein